jgi:probable addiction module antidote protein
METKKAAAYDAAEFLETDEDIVAYLNAALEDGDPSLLAAALGDVARARGMTQLARETGITRDGLYKALSPSGNPSFATVQKVVRALGYKLDVAVAV